MINLLPPEQKNRLLKERKRKMLLILIILINTFVLCLGFILLSVKIHISGDIEAENILFSFEQRKFEESGHQLLEEKIEYANKSLTGLKSFYKKQILAADFVEKILKALPESMWLNELSFFKDKKQFILNGHSKTRDDLFVFKKNLEAQGCFEDIYFPLESLVKSQDIDFTIRFILNNDNS